MCKLENKIIKVLIYRLTNIILNFIIFLFKLAYTIISLQEKSELETDNSVSNPSENGIPDGLETEFSVFKTSNCVRLNSVSNQRQIRDGIISSQITDGIEFRI